MTRVLLMGFSLIAIAIGYLVASRGDMAGFYILPILLAAAVMADYRLAVVFLALVIPFSGSPWLPIAPALNPITHAVMLGSISLLVKKMLSQAAFVWLPRAAFIGIVIPLFAGLAIGFQYNHLAPPEWDFITQPIKYTQAFLVKPLFLVFLAWLIANGVRDSKRPAGFIVLFFGATLLTAFSIVYTVATTGRDLDELRQSRTFLTDLGLHTNSTGQLLAFAVAPLLWVTFSLRGVKKLACAGVTGLVTLALLLTFTRASYIALIVVLGVFLWQRRQVRVVLGTAVVLSALVAFAPDAFVNRVSTGVDAGTVADAKVGKEDSLSSGRIRGYFLLIPEITRSPLWGRGTSSTAWSGPVRKGQYDSNHPHSFFLSVILDLGLIGFALIAYLYFAHLRAFRRAAIDPSVPPPIRAFFEGSRAGIFGLLTLYVVNAPWYPEPPQTYLWFAFGILWAYWLESGSGGTNRGKQPATESPMPSVVVGSKPPSRIV